MKSTKKYLISLLLGSIILLFTYSCDDLVETGTPDNIITIDQGYSDARTVRAIANGLYTQNLLSNGIYYWDLEDYIGQLADDYIHTATAFDDLRNNTYTPTNTYTAVPWEDFYKSVFYSNDIINNFPNLTIIPEEEKQIYIGEAKYFRAYSYFVLATLYGNVPYITSTKILETALQGRDSKELIVGKVIQDLKDVEVALENSDNPNTKITKWAASALLARQYLYNGNWPEAEAKANDVITNSGYELEETLEKVFVRSSKETIFKISYNGTNPSYLDRTPLAQLYANANRFRFTDDLTNSFEAGDLRKTKWTVAKSSGAYYQQNKYRRTSASSTGEAEDLVRLRLAEQYLIRAEARAQQDKLTGVNGAIADLDSIRLRAGLPVLPQTLTKEETLLAVEKERRSEFFLEELHRWWDLVRTGRADAVLGNTTNFPNKKWESYKALLPVPEGEIDLNPNLAPNNPGYGNIN